VSSVIVLPVTGSIGSSPVSFALRFGFDAIFAAIGFSGVAVDPDTVVDVDPACFEVDEEPGVVAVAVVAAGLPDVDFAGLPLVAGLPVPCVVVATGLPLVVGLPVWRVVDAAGLPLVVGLTVGLTDAGGLAEWPCPWANTGDTVKDAAATKAKIVVETRIRVPPWRRIASGMPRRLCAQRGLKSPFVGKLWINSV
jgi:hypothetical protein